MRDRHLATRAARKRPATSAADVAERQPVRGDDVEVVPGIAGGDRAAEQVALRAVAAVLAQERALRLGLDPFRDDLEAEAVAERITVRTIAVFSLSMPMSRTSEPSIFRRSIGKRLRWASEA